MIDRVLPGSWRSDCRDVTSVGMLTDVWPGSRSRAGLGVGQGTSVLCMLFCCPAGRNYRRRKERTERVEGTKTFRGQAGREESKGTDPRELSTATRQPIEPPAPFFCAVKGANSANSGNCPPIWRTLEECGKAARMLSGHEVAV